MLTPQAGELIAARYRLERELARGGMGSVWEGRDTKLRRKVAVKLVAPDWLSGDKASTGGSEAAVRDATERFEREAMAVAQLQSPHVVQIFDYGLEREVPYIVMELLEGEDLRSRLHRLKRVSLETAALILVQTAKALSVAHAAGIVHRDLKPGNVFLVRAGEEEIVKVLDFGVAMQVTDLLEADVEHKVMGTPQFMSPEQARGLPDLDHRADLWSLGIIVYKALTGRLPFQGGSPTDVIVKVCTTEAEPISKLAPDLPRELDGFFQKALARDPAERFGSAREMALAFSRISPVNFTTLSMPDPKAIEEAIARARAVGAVDEDEAETLAVDALTMMQLDEDFLEDLKTKMITPELIAARLPVPQRRGGASGAALPRPQAATTRGGLRPPQRPQGGPDSASPNTLRYPPPPTRASRPNTLRPVAPPSDPTNLRPPVARSGAALAPGSGSIAGASQPGAPPSSKGLPPPSAPSAARSPSASVSPASLSAPPTSAPSASEPASAHADVPPSAAPADVPPSAAPAIADELGEPPSSRTLHAVEREPSLPPPPQTRKALAMALAAMAVGVAAAAVGSALFRGPEVALIGLVAPLDGARVALHQAAEAAEVAEAAEPEPEEATEAADDADGVEDADAADDAETADDADGTPDVATEVAAAHTNRRPLAAPPPVVRPPAPPPPPPPPKEEAPKKPVDVFSERL